MITRMTQVMGGIGAVALVVWALWGWGQAAWIAEDANRPAVAMWAIRSGSIAAVAGAQVLVLTCVVGAFYRRRPVDQMLKLGAGLIATLAVVSAIALTFAGS